MEKCEVKSNKHYDYHCQLKIPSIVVKIQFSSLGSYLRSRFTHANLLYKLFFYKQYFCKQRQTEIGKNSYKS